MAFYVHCCSHNLNPILMDAACALCSAGTLETLYCFLMSSLPRFNILQEEQHNLLEGTVLTLKGLSDTRWASRKQGTDAVIQGLPAILEALCHTKEHNSTTPKTSTETTCNNSLLMSTQPWTWVTDVWMISHSCAQCSFSAPWKAGPRKWPKSATTKLIT